MEEIILYAVMIMIMMLWGVTVAAGGFPTTMELHRAVPATHLSDLSHVLARDRARHGRLLQQYGIHIPVQGNVDQYGIYYTRVQIGSPPKDFYVHIDTGSDIPWISCSVCNDCPKYSNLPIDLSFYDPKNSSSSSLISCWDPKCEIAVGTTEPGCSGHTSHCGYRLFYQDGSITSGFFVSDLLHLRLNISTSGTNYSTPIFFGCSTTRVESFPSVNIADGIFGFGHSGSSIISQLAREGMTPKVFAHCFRGGNVGGGSLVLGEVIEPGIVYTPLIQSQPLYRINLYSISVGGRLLDIDPSIFIKPESRRAIIDSGTTLAYLPEAAYIPLIAAITTAVSKSTEPYLLDRLQCYKFNSSVDSTFPWVSLNFAGSASLVLSPRDYLQQDSPTRWCMGILKSEGQEITLLGDLVMRDKIIIYDLEAQRMGWVNYDCSLPVNVSGFHGDNRRSKSSSLKSHYWLILTSIVACLCSIVAGGLLYLWRHKFKDLSRSLCLRFPFF